MKVKNLFIVVGAEHYNPLGMVRSLGENGIRPIVVVYDAKVKITSSSKYCGEIYHVRNVAEGYDLILKKWGNMQDKPFILASDDLTVSFYDQRYDEIKDRFYFYNAGRQGRITEVMEKECLCRMAEDCGMAIPKTYRVRNGNIPNGLEYPVLTKAGNSFSDNWKESTHICRDEGQLKKAFAEIRQKDVIIQRYINKKNELCLDGYSWNKGKKVFIGIASNYKYILSDRYSSYMDIFNFQNEKLQQALERMIALIGFEGIFSVEFLVDQNDALFFLEINFRNSTWSYASTKVGMNLVIGWCRAMLEGDKHVPIYRDIEKGFTAMNELSDFKIRVLGRRVGVGRWIRDLRQCNCKFYSQRNDKKPLRAVLLSKLLRGKV